MVKEQPAPPRQLIPVVAASLPESSSLDMKPTAVPKFTSSLKLTRTHSAPQTSKREPLLMDEDSDDF